MNDLDLLREQVSWELRRNAGDHDPDDEEVDGCIQQGYTVAAAVLDSQATGLLPGVSAVLHALAREMRRRQQFDGDRSAIR